MLTRRDLLRGAAIGAGGIVVGTGVVTLGRRLLTASGTGGGLIMPPGFNDEFNGPNTEWTVAGSNDVEFDGVTHPGAVFLESGMAIHRARVPTPPFTVTARCSSILFNDIDSQFANASLAIGGDDNPATTGPKFYAFQWDVAFLGEIGVIDGVWSNYTTQIHQNHYTKLGDGLTFQVPHYQRLVVVSGNDISCYWSLDGVAWNTYIEHFDPDVDVEAVLLVSFGVETAWDWVRFS